VSDLITLPVMSFWEPWAFGILNLGKDVENRPWGTKFRGWLGIQAAKRRLNASELREIVRWLRSRGLEQAAAALPPPGSPEYAYGELVGVVKVVGCDPLSGSRWAAPGRMHWRLERAATLVERIPCTGRQGFWRVPVPVDVLPERVLRELRP